MTESPTAKSATSTFCVAGWDPAGGRRCRQNGGSQHLFDLVVAQRHGLIRVADETEYRRRA